jgi:hypothetical protein
LNVYNTIVLHMAHYWTTIHEDLFQQWMKTRSDEDFNKIYPTIKHLAAQVLCYKRWPDPTDHADAVSHIVHKCLDNYDPKMGSGYGYCIANAHWYTKTLYQRNVIKNRNFLTTTMDPADMVNITKQSGSCITPEDMDRLDVIIDEMIRDRDWLTMSTKPQDQTTMRNITRRFKKILEGERRYIKNPNTDKIIRRIQKKLEK